MFKSCDQNMPNYLQQCVDSPNILYQNEMHFFHFRGEIKSRLEGVLQV